MTLKQTRLDITDVATLSRGDSGRLAGASSPRDLAETPLDSL
jgi:hypothetical protein